MKKMLVGLVVAGCLMAGDKKPDLKAQVKALTEEVTVLKGQLNDRDAALKSIFGDYDGAFDQVAFILRDLTGRIKQLENPRLGTAKRPGVQEHNLDAYGREANR